MRWWEVFFYHASRFLATSSFLRGDTCLSVLELELFFSFIFITLKFTHDIENLRAFLLVWNTFLITIFYVIFVSLFLSFDFNLLGTEFYNFFYLWCLWSNNMSDKFKKLEIVFLFLFYFIIQHYLKNNNYMVIFNFFFISLLQSRDLSHKFCRSFLNKDFF